MRLKGGARVAIEVDRTVTNLIELEQGENR